MEQGRQTSHENSIQLQWLTGYFIGASQKETVDVATVADHLYKNVFFGENDKTTLPELKGLLVIFTNNVHAT